jgi:O-acetyl-ADP-ribose deacetylase (regulator of RNase III)
MTTFIDASGNLLESPCDAIINTVNTVGVMGKGLALQFKRAFPDNFKAYEQACKNGKVCLGCMFIFEINSLLGVHYIINFPTKSHWRLDSNINDIAVGLDDLRRVITELSIKSMAIPPLGCGLGGLHWRDVEPLIKEKLAGLDLDAFIFSPA